MLKIAHLPFLITILVVNAIYFILIDSASLHGIQLINLQVWVFLLLMTTAYLLMESIATATDKTSQKLLRFSVVLAWLCGIFHLLEMSGNSVFLVNVTAVGAGLLGFSIWMLDKSTKSPKWFFVVGYMASMNFSAIAGFFFLADFLVIVSFMIGELFFLCGLVFAIFTARLTPLRLGLVIAFGLVGGAIMSLALSNDVMFLVLNLIMTRVLGIVGFQGIPYASYFSILLFFQFSATATFLILEKKYFYVTLGLTGVGVSYAPVIFIRNYLLFQYSRSNSRLI